MKDKKELLTINIGGENTGYRNGYEPFNIKTAEGKICVYKPQVRNIEKPFHSKLAAFFRNNSKVLEKLALEMYARGLSTRDIENALIEATGDMIFWSFLQENWDLTK